jgi:hypothetical protein
MNGPIICYTMVNKYSFPPTFLPTMELFVLLMGVQLVKLSLSEIICVLKYVYSNYELFY